MPNEPTGRRPLKTRDWPFFINLAAWLARSGATPNGISFVSSVFGCAAGGSLAATSAVGGRWIWLCWLGAAVFIQLRLIANLLDGMVAVEGRKGGPTGDLWNEAPDRVSDAAIFVGAGFAVGSCPLLGMTAALVAVFVAYVRALGASVGAGQVFLGPMAKPHRMALLTGISVLSAVFSALHWPLQWTSWSQLHPIGWALVIVVVAGTFTAWRRLVRIAALLRAKAS